MARSLAVACLVTVATATEYWASYDENDASYDSDDDDALATYVAAPNGAIIANNRDCKDADPSGLRQIIETMELEDVSVSAFPNRTP